MVYIYINKCTHARTRARTRTQRTRTRTRARARARARTRTRTHTRTHTHTHTHRFAILGNHDHYGNAEAQIEFSKLGVDPRWVMPNYFYTTVREIPGTGHSVQHVFIGIHSQKSSLYAFMR